MTSAAFSLGSNGVLCRCLRGLLRGLQGHDLEWKILMVKLWTPQFCFNHEYKTEIMELINITAKLKNSI